MQRLANLMGIKCWVGREDLNLVDLGEDDPNLVQLSAEIKACNLKSFYVLGGNRAPQLFRHTLAWSFVSFEKQHYQVKETQGNVTLRLLRRGYPNTTIYVG